jgi:hypothetical protein
MAKGYKHPFSDNLVGARNHGEAARLNRIQLTRKNMRKIFWTSLLLWPALCLAQTSNLPESKVVPSSIWMMAIEPTQTVDFEGSLKQLRGRLQLIEAQQSAWTVFEKSVQAYSQQFFAEKPLSASKGESAPRQVELLAERLQQRVNAVKDIGREANALYVVLDAQQQKTADLHLIASIPVFGNSPSER